MHQQKLACVFIVWAVSKHCLGLESLKPRDPSVLGKEVTQHPSSPLLPSPDLSCYPTIHDVTMLTLLQES